ncbi:glutathione S-transferase [Sorangium cellulosum]|uniref:glutathione transferase n=2 Tax=Sorangium cellulosum TaxID=56 RepID=A0A150PCD7_SORCE|nr:glutathione binding-like protein [Sorangium cellulosum]AGP32591.1 glutathione S-transferase [Sorangium cellulosum So0157-2]KYF53322.1 glutathione S-transferase [Sorangium cellulosum]
MKIYGHPMSTCTRKVLTVLAEKGHDAQLVVVDLMKGAQKQPEHLARHPFGVIPVLEDGDFTLYESRAIIRYLDQKLPGPSLTPTELRAKALMDQWLSVEQSYFSTPAVKIAFQRVFYPMRGQQSDESVVEAAKAEVARTLDVADKALAGQEYLAGSTYSLADISWMPYLHCLVISKVEDLINDRPNVAAWWKRISARPAWAKVSS